MAKGGKAWKAYLKYDESLGKPAVSRSLLTRVARFARPYYGQVALMLALMLITALIELVPPLLYGDLINGLGKNAFGRPTLTVDRLNLLAGGLLGIPIITSLLGTWQRQLSAAIGEGQICDLRVAMYQHMQRMSLRFFTATKTGDIISRLSNDVVGAQSAVTSTIPNVITNVLTLVTTLAVMLRLEWRLTLVAIAILPLFLLPTRRVGRMLRDIRRQGADLNARMSSHLQETLNVSGALLVRTFGRGDDETARFGEAAQAVRDIGIRRAVVGRWFSVGLGIAAAIGTALIYWLGGYFAIQGALSAGLIVTFAAYVKRLYDPITSLSNIQVDFATSLVSFERVFEYLDLPIEIDERPDAVVLERVAGAIRFEDVWFNYVPIVTEPVEAAEVTASENGIDGAARPEGVEPSDKGAIPPAVAEASGKLKPARAGDSTSSKVSPVPADGTPTNDVLPAQHSRQPSRPWTLEGIDFAVEPGQMVALVGPSGAGKTTVGYLMTRLYDPLRGRITLDGHDLRDLKLASLANHVGMVTQEATLFHASIQENLLFARPTATEEAIVAACRAANIHDFIESLPAGYETIVGERGYRLSGGEKQRLALARVILKDPAVILLDEATSHLDSQSEALIQEALARVMTNRTSLVIAHRLSTVLAADQILVFQEGKIVERGRHEELIAKDGLYAKLFETQFRAGEGSAGRG